MPERGIITINASDGLAVATVNFEAMTIDEYVHITFVRHGTGQTVEEFVGQLNDVFAEENEYGTSHRKRGIELLTPTLYGPSDAKSAARSHVKDLMERGGFLVRWSVNTRNGKLVLLDNVSRRKAAKQCTCRRR